MSSCVDHVDPMVHTAEETFYDVWSCTTIFFFFLLDVSVNDRVWVWVWILSLYIVYVCSSMSNAFFFYVIYIIYLITWDPSLWANCKCHSNELKWKHKIVLTRPRKLKFIFLPESRDGYISKNLCRYGWVRTSHSTLRSLEFFIFMYFLYVILVVYISVLKLYFYHVLVGVSISGSVRF